MHFRLRYVMDGIKLELGKDETLKFPFGGKHPVVVTILRLAEESNHEKATLICECACEQEVEQCTHEDFQRFRAGGPLEVASRALFNQILWHLYGYMQKTVMTLRWRCSIVDGPTNTFRNGKEAYSFDGTVWQEEPKRVASIKIFFGNPYPAGISE
jgi:hypothetical protein